MSQANVQTQGRNNLLLLRKAMRDAKDPVSFFFLAFLTKLVIALRFKRFNVYGRENLPVIGPYICIANHSSRWDGPTLGAVINRPANFMVSPNELKGLQGFLLHKVGAFPAHPKLDFVGHVLKQFAKGEPFVIFPEGNVFYDGHTHNFKKGAARVALAACQAGLSVPVVPVGIRYENGQASYNIGRPIAVEEYAALWCENPVQALKSLTARLEREVGYLSAELGNELDRRQLTALDDNQIHFLSSLPGSMVKGGGQKITTGSLMAPSSLPLESSKPARI